MSDCEYCADEGLTPPEPAVMCIGHFNNTMAIANEQVEFLQEKIKKYKKAIHGLILRSRCEWSEPVDLEGLL